MLTKKLVLVLFPSVHDAEAAADAMKATRLVEGDAMGVIALDDGQLRVDKIGGRSWGAGGLIGAGAMILGTGGLGLGIIAGSLVGGLHRKSLGMTEDDRARLADALRGGEAALGIKVLPEDWARVMVELEKLGGRPESYEVAEEVLEAVNKAVAEAQDASGSS